MEIGHIGIWRSRNRGGADAADEIEAARLRRALDRRQPVRRPGPALPGGLEHGCRSITGILNVWQHDPADVARRTRGSPPSIPDRFLLGIGVGHPEATSDYTRPLKAMREFFDGLDAAETPVPKDERVAAALGPKMLDLAAERSLGTHPYFIALEHTLYARERVGEDVLVAPEVAVVRRPEPGDRPQDRARVRQALPRAARTTRTTCSSSASREDDFARRRLGPPDRRGDPARLAERVAADIEAHLEAGADHVCLQPLGSDEPTRDYAALAAVLL